MSVFLQQLIEHKKYIFISLTCFLITGILYGFYQYHHVSEDFQNFFQYLFYLNIEGYDNHYELYVLQNSLFIFLCTYLSTSYFGYIGISFLGFLKGIQISFSLYYVFSNIQMSFVYAILIIFELAIEIMLYLSMNIIFNHVSIYVFYVTFVTEQNFHMKSMLNYHLNGLIFALSLFFISLAFRIYFIPMF